MPFLLFANTLRLVPGPGNEMRLQVFKTGLLSGKKHEFVFERFAGEAVYNATAMENSSVRFEIDAASVTLLDTWVSEKEREKILDFTRNEMLAVKRFPKIVYQSVAVRRMTNEYLVEGNLTIRGITKPAEVSLTYRDGTFTGHAEVNMKSYGLKPPSAALGMIGTKEIMVLTFHLKPVQGS